MTLEEFHSLIGQTVMYCQIIEHDVKRIYAAMKKGGFYDNLKEVEKLSLGQTVKELKELDFSCSPHYISEDDYDFLRLVTSKRNHWCHEAYQKFVYTDLFLNSNEYKTECKKLSADTKRLSSVYVALENARIKAMKDFKRV